MSKMRATVGVAAVFVLASGKKGTPPQQTSPALTMTNESMLQPAVAGSRRRNSKIYCDHHKHHYCDTGGACCPDFHGKYFCTDDLWANCFIYEKRACPGAAPIICGEDCCGPDFVCRNGQCEDRTLSDEHHASALTSSAGFGKMQLTQSTPPLGWKPDISDWDDGMLRTAHEGLHNMFLAVQANSWRNEGTFHPGQCYVIGFPADLGKCTNPWDDGCKGSAATIIQDGDMTLYNDDPILNLVGENTLDWCNDDYNPQGEIGTGKWVYTETQTVSFTQSKTTKVTKGRSDTTTVSENIEIEKGSEKYTFSFSMEVDTSESSTQTNTTKKTWEQDLTTNVGPRSHVYTKCALSQATIDCPYDMKVKLHTPIVWACTSPEEDADHYVYPLDSAYWQSFNIEKNMESQFGFDAADLEAIFSAKIGGTFKAVMGQKVVCSTHTVKLQPGESCPHRQNNGTSILV